MFVRQRASAVWSFALVTSLALAGCAGQEVAAPYSSRVAPHATPGAPATSTAAPGAPPLASGATHYTDPQLGFQIDALAGWSVQAYPGVPAADGAPAASSVVLIDSAAREDVIQVTTLSGPAMPAAFFQHGAPDTHIGSYPAFTLDISLNGARVPCLIRVFLAGNDYVIASLCAMNAPQRLEAYEQTLATYRPTPAPVAPLTVPATVPSDCAQAWSSQRETPLPSGWGQTLADPAATGWRQLRAGVALCSNTQSTDPYFFQCTELINRFLLERRGLAHIPGNSARYFDYALDGVIYPGRVREFPAGYYALSNDASQGTSAFAPAAGDLLIFQDVADPDAGWRSGLINSPGHIALITGVDATHVYIAQENYSDSAYFQALPLRHVATGYEITDLSGIPNRIVRGWIRLGA